MKEGQADFFRKVWSQSISRYGDLQRGPYSGVAYKVADGVRRYVFAISREQIDNNQALAGVHDSLDSMAQEKARKIVARSNIRSLEGKEHFRSAQKALALKSILDENGIEKLIIEAGEYIVKTREQKPDKAGKLPA